ncbi:hypothetical protein LTR09_006709 [Extremus antarcticus]|uniref:DUF7514 domain-containing protein n=1 Tax=Extremus antarcticus TaxID=702011 RepID=A0AAJ0DE44_9PEZI|nr:hypothetical protein LTR09_006709 [Extremus antarcticus]
MASEGMRAPSPPLPPDPTRTSFTFTGSRPQPPLAGQQAHYQSSSATPSTSQAQVQAALERVDSLRSPPLSVNSPVLQQQRQPITNAVNDAANNVFEHSPVTNQLDPEYIKQLTADVTAEVTRKVLQELQSTGAAPTPTAHAPQPFFPPPPSPFHTREQRSPRSPPQEATDYHAAQFTPPTPDRVPGSQEERAYMSSSPGPPASDVGSTFSRESWESTRSYESENTPRPYVTDINGGRATRSSNVRRRESNTPAEPDFRSRQESCSEESRERNRQNSRESQASYDGAPGSRARPVRVPDVEETPIEKIWQPLFDNGHPTPRLGQFLRGLATHIIDDYEPKGSLVVTPAKMLRFFNETKIVNEIYPWDMIFGGKLSMTSVSTMFQKLLCQHHLVQERHDAPPTVPGLTPRGFDWFMTCLIQAHPDSEYERIAKAVRDMPISNGDDKSERFPKELSRRLFPPVANIQAQQRLFSSLSHDPRVLSALKGTSAMPPPPPSGPPNPSFGERERMPYGSSQQSNTVDDDDLAGPPPVNIERERKPYTAPQGTGRTYGSDDSRPPPNSSRPEGPSRSRSTRTKSSAPPQASYNNSGPSDPMNIPSRAHRMSTPGMPPQNGNSNGQYSKSRRASPPSQNPYTRSEPGFADASKPQNTSSQRPSREYPEDDEEKLRRYRSRSRVDRNSLSTGNPPDDDPRGYPIPGRSVPVNNGIFEYGSSANQGGGPPLGTSVPGSSYLNRRPPMNPNGTEDRRRSTYNPPTTAYGEGGSDGYGSYSNTNSGYAPPQAQYGSSSQH